MPGDISSVHTGLVPKAVHYINIQTGAISTNSTNGVMFGKALNANELLLLPTTDQQLFNSQL
jgi:hypothetical protein